MARTVDQEGLSPSEKVKGATAGGAAGVVLIWAAKQFFDVDMPPGVGEALTVLLAFVGGYFKREKEQAHAG